MRWTRCACRPGRSRISMSSGSACSIAPLVLCRRLLLAAWAIAPPVTPLLDPELIATIIDSTPYLLVCSQKFLLGLFVRFLLRRFPLEKPKHAPSSLEGYASIPASNLKTFTGAMQYSLGSKSTLSLSLLRLPREGSLFLWNSLKTPLFHQMAQIYTNR
jgi:hypothetical protein